MSCITFHFFNIFLLIYFILYFLLSIIDYTHKIYYDGILFFNLFSVHIIIVLVIRNVVNIYLFF